MHFPDISTAAVIPQQLLNLRGVRSLGSWWSDHLDRSGDKAVDNDRDHVNCSGHIPRQQLKARDHHQVTNRTTYVHQYNSQKVLKEKYLLFLRNSAIFWAMSMSSLLIGNLQCFFMFQGEEYITSATRNTLGVILIIVSGLGTALMFGLRPPPSQSQDEVWINNSRPN